MEQVPNRRSVAPIVLGVLSVVCACLGLLMAALVTSLWNHEVEALSLAELGTFGHWVPAWMGLSVALFGVHLTSGILLLRYHPSAPTWLTIYGVLALLLAVADMVISVFGLPEEAADLVEQIGYVRLGLNVFNMPWPIAAIILANLPMTRRACSKAHSVPSVQPGSMGERAGAPEDDFSLLHSTPSIKAAGVTTLSAGIVSLLLALQTYGVTRMMGVTVTAVILMASFGVLSSLLGVMQLRVRGWACAAGMVVSGAGFALSSLWLGFSVVHGLVSLFAFLLVALALVSAISSLFALPRGRLADRARGRLEEQGLMAGN